MGNKTTRKLTIVAIVIMLGTILVHTPVIGFAQGQSTTKVLRIGYFPNINHAQAVIGFGSGEFQKELGNNIKVQTYVSYSSSFSK